MSDFTPNLGLPYLLSNQAQKHVTLNESLRALDGLLQLSVLDRDLTVPPASPADGDRYLVAESAGDVWSGNDGQVALFSDGGWLFFTARAGWRAWVEDEARFLVFDGSVWRETTSSELQNLSLLGLGATADSNNPLLAKLNAALFTALEAGNSGSGDLRFKLNKETAGNVLSLLLQTNYSSRAEIGLVGDEDLVLKVSPDGASFYEGIRIDKDDGKVSFPSGISGVDLTDLNDTPSDLSGQGGQHLAVNSSETAIEFVQSAELLTADRDYYVNAASGSDMNDGLSSGAPFLTIQKAIDVIAGLLIGPHNVTIHLADGIYGGVSVDAPFLGTGSVTLAGNTASPGNVILGDGEDYGVVARNGARISVEGVKINAAKACLQAQYGGHIIVSDKIALGGPASQGQILAEGTGAVVESAGQDIDFTADAGMGLRAIFGGYIRLTGGTLNFTDNWNYSSAFVLASYLGNIYATGSTFSGSYAGVTGRRHTVSANSVVNTSGGGASYFPGDVAGVTSSGGQYL